jgi:hypothetical protein
MREYVSVFQALLFRIIFLSITRVCVNNGHPVFSFLKITGNDTHQLLPPMASFIKKSISFIFPWCMMSKKSISLRSVTKVCNLSQFIAIYRNLSQFIAIFTEPILGRISGEKKAHISIFDTETILFTWGSAPWTSGLRIDSTIETFSPRYWFKIFGQADNGLNYIFTCFSVFCDGHAQPEKNLDSHLSKDLCDHELQLWGGQKVMSPPAISRPA